MPSLDKRRIIVDFSNERQGVCVEAVILMASTMYRAVVVRSVMDRVVVHCAYRMRNDVLGVIQMVQWVQVVESV